MARFRTDYKDDKLLVSANTRRKFNVIENEDGTVSFTDGTKYEKKGDNFGAAQVNAIHGALNEMNADLEKNSAEIEAVREEVAQIANDQIPEEYLKAAVDEYVAENSGGFATQAAVEAVQTELRSDLSKVNESLDSMCDEKTTQIKDAGYTVIYSGIEAGKTYRIINNTSRSASCIFRRSLPTPKAEEIPYIVSGGYLDVTPDEDWEDIRVYRSVAIDDGTITVRIVGTIVEKMQSDIANIQGYEAEPEVGIDCLYGDIVKTKNGLRFFDGTSFIDYKCTNEPYDTEMGYDVVILGGGTGGVASAYAFIDKGYKVALIEKNNALGGVACVGGVATWIEGLNTPMLENVFNEMKALGQANGSYDASWMPQKFSGVTGSPLNFMPDKMSEKYASDLSGSVDIFYNSFVKSVYDSVGGTIKSILAYIDGKTVRVYGKFFIDATSNAELICSMNNNRNVDYFYGRDLRTKYNESLAMEKVTQILMNEPSYFFKLEHNYDDSALLDSITTVYRNGNEIVKPDYITLTGYAFNHLGQLCVNPMMGAGLQGSYALLNSVHDYHAEIKKRTLEFWKFVKLKCQINYELYGAGTYGGWSTTTREYGFKEFFDMVSDRESFRVNCDTMLTQNDLSTLAQNETDVIAVGSHNVDCHVSTGLGDITTFNATMLKPYSIRYGSIVPTNINNCFVASKCFGASQLAQFSARISKVINQLGWTAGNATLIALQDGLSDIRNVDMTKLKSAEYTDFNNRFTTTMSHYSY